MRWYREMPKKLYVKNNLFDAIANSFEKESNQPENSDRVRKSQTRSPQERERKPTGQLPPKKQTIENKTQQVVSSIKKPRTIFIKYKKRSGGIVAIQEILQKRENFRGLPWLEIPGNMDAKPFDLTGELINKPIIEIHRNYKIKKSGRRLELTRKR